MTRWQTIDPLWPLGAPAVPACYVVFRSGRAVYVGQTTDLRARLRTHRFREGYGSDVITPWGSWKHDELSMKARLSTRYGDWAMRELRLIKRLQPEMNCLGSTRKRGAAS